MIKAYLAEGGRLRAVDGLPENPDAVVWADLLQPTREEEAAIESWLGIGIPTREEMEEIEISSRLYSENGAVFMTATLPAKADGDFPAIMPVTFVLAGHRLVTLRYHEPRAFQAFSAQAEKTAPKCSDGPSILVALVEMIVDLLADHLEGASSEIATISYAIFHVREKKASKRDLSFQVILRQIGRKEDAVGKIQDSLVSLQRLSGYLGTAGLPVDLDKELRARLKTIGRDVVSLSGHASYMSQKVTFLLDATLGMINIEQNGIMQIVSVATVVFLPPTLVASLYGMNFEIMPELHWKFGYPAALLAMLVSAVVPYWFFKRKGWL